MNCDISIFLRIIADLNLCADQRCPDFIRSAFDTDQSARIYGSFIMKQECFTNFIFIDKD